jgi:uncharacterized damage-inducible protein DinB
MEVWERLRRELAYNAWANQETHRSLDAASTVPDRAAVVMAHIIAAEWLWLRRLGQSCPPMAVWPTLSPSVCKVQLHDLSHAWQDYLQDLASESLLREVSYINSQGEHWSNSVADILTHVVLHSSYHRGQIATLLGRAGEKAAYTDYIECVRRDYLSGRWPDSGDG